MKCQACQKELAKKDVLYTEDKVPFCNNPYTCNEEHPNSVKNILARQEAAPLYTEEEFEVNLFENLDVSDEMKDRILKITNKPQSIRLSKIEIAYYLVKLQETNDDLKSLSDCIRFCVEHTMETMPVTDEAFVEKVNIPEGVVDPEKPAKEIPKQAELTQKAKAKRAEKAKEKEKAEALQAEEHPKEKPTEQEEFTF